MKKLISTLVIFLSFLSLYSQSTGFKYQAVVRDGEGLPLTNKEVSFRISILRNDIAQYVELHNLTTSTYGLVDMIIGMGEVEDGIFSSISWGEDNFFLKLEVDKNGGSDYSVLGTSQLLSVPYAMHASSANEITGTINEHDPIFGVSPASEISSSDIVNWNKSVSNHIENVFFPNGIGGTPVLFTTATSYTVPEGKSLYLSAGYSNGIEITSGTLGYYFDHKGVIKENTTIDIADGKFFTFMLVDEQYEIVNWNTTTNYTVPSGKKLVLISFLSHFALTVNGTSAEVASSRSPFLFLPEGAELAWDSNISPQKRDYIFSGYLLDL